MGEWRGPEPHELTAEDRQKGRETMTERKRRSLALNPLKHGKYSKVLAEDFTFCDGCAYKHSCAVYKPGEACHLQLQFLRELNKVATGDAQAWLNTALHSLQRLYVLSQQEESPVKAHQRFIREWLELGKILFPKQVQISQGEREIKVVFDDSGNDKD